MATDETPVPPEEPEEETLKLEPLTPAMVGRLKRCFSHGKLLISQKKVDYDYATDMFAECVTHDPASKEYLDAFLDNLQAKFKNNKKGGRAKGFKGKGAFKKAYAKKDWREVLKEGVHVLKANPWDVPTLRAMAEACAAYRPDLNDVELRYLKNALDKDHKDAEVNRHCAKSLTRMGQYDQAIACWRRIEEYRRGDAEAPRAIAALMMEKSRGAAGVDDDDLTE